MIEVLLLLPVFAAMATAGTSIAIQYRLAKSRGPEIPSMKPRPAVAPLDRERQYAIEIGKRELNAPAADLWDREFHRALERTGAERENVIPGDYIIESNYSGSRVVEYLAPDQYSLVGCTCRECQARGGTPFHGASSSDVEIYHSVPVWERERAARALDFRRKNR